MTDDTPIIRSLGGLGIRAHRLVPRHDDVIDRRDLTEPHEIRERMARDILAARREGITGPVDLTEHGWTAARVTRHGAPAHDLARDVHFVTRDVVERHRLAEAAGEAAVAAALAAPITGDMVAMVDGLELATDEIGGAP